MSELSSKLRYPFFGWTMKTTTFASDAAHFTQTALSLAPVRLSLPDLDALPSLANPCATESTELY